MKIECITVKREKKWLKRHNKSNGLYPYNIESWVHIAASKLRLWKAIIICRHLFVQKSLKLIWDDCYRLKVVLKTLIWGLHNFKCCECLFKNMLLIYMILKKSGLVKRPLPHAICHAATFTKSFCACWQLKLN